MKLRYLFVTSLVALAMSGCGQSKRESPAESEAQGAEPVAVACPEANEEGVIEIQPGLSATVMSNGYGRVAAEEDFVGVHADLWVYDDSQPANKGLKVWSSGGEEPFEFQIGSPGFIDGWSPGIKCMHLGETRELIIAPDLAYGERGRPPVPPNATLLYELELVTVGGPEDSSEPATE